MASDSKSKKPLVKAGTAEHLYNKHQLELKNSSRRLFLKSSLTTSLAIASSGLINTNLTAAANLPSQNYTNITADTPNSWREITNYNNYYEFSTNKKVIVHLAKVLKIKPWTITIEGEVEKSITVDINELLSNIEQEQRIYRLRCVEGWSMVIPWTGFSLSHLLKLAQPTSKAKYVEFVSLLRPKEMIGQRLQTLNWPFREGLRLDEAMHPLTFIATGLYGKPLPKQNGAPLRLVVPWKYAFKSIKAITHIRLLDHQPTSSWQSAAASEYGFYANVNPNVAHPRWTQQRENRIGELKKRPTLMFNGYEEQVAHLYQGMDLVKHF